jgi:3-oxoacyl-[acyl-carrier-protein] synthase II
MSVAIVAFGAVSALGEGEQAAHVGSVGEPARVVIGRDEELARAGLARPFAARVVLRPSSSPPVPGQTAVPAALSSLAAQETEEDRATRLLRRAMTGCAASLDERLPGWRGERIGLAIGTSSGGLRTAERVFTGLRQGSVPSSKDAAGSLYFAPMHQAASSLGLAFGPATLVLGACAASTIAIGLGMRWLSEGACDLVLAGGFDAVSVMVAAGFEVLRATTGEVPPRPFRLQRDGMALGEGAAVLALRDAARAPKARAYAIGFGASSDAVHLTAPDRTGGGLARAARAALEEASNPVVDLVSSHATATPFNDAAEARAVEGALGASGFAHAVEHPFKAQIGHTLGAAGALETLAAVDAMTRGILPAAAGSGPMDPNAPANLLETGVAGKPEVALKLSAAFGGANAALVVSRDARPSRARVRRAAFLRAPVHIDAEPEVAALAAECGIPLERLARADLLTRYTLAAVAALKALYGPLRGSAIVVGEAFATLETDALFHRRLSERGVRMAEPRRFPYTSPNAAPGDASVAFGLTGPGFAVGGGLHAGVEALVIAADLVRAGDADNVVVVAADEVGPVVLALAAQLGIPAPRSGAVGVLVTSQRTGAMSCIGRTELRLGRGFTAEPVRPGHLALLPLLSRPLPPAVEGASPSVGSSTPAGRPGSDAPSAFLSAAYARVELEPA